MTDLPMGSTQGWQVWGMWGRWHWCAYVANHRREGTARTEREAKSVATQALGRLQDEARAETVREIK